MTERDFFPRNRKDILGKREKLSGHKSVGEFFDTCRILRVRSPIVARTLHPVIAVTRENPGHEGSQIRNSNLQTDTLSSKHERRRVRPAVVPPTQLFP